ncbi:MAG: substrate-binding domain-containing protein [Pseudomonadota bacterium]|nr:MAG: substrate-binding domain-containing protein [Pseudomonadota bacterium]
MRNCVALKTLLRASVLTATALLVMATAYAQSGVVRLSTTTSTENSGLLEELLPRFEQRSGLRVEVIAVGTGKALRMGRDGDVDVVLVHAPAAEEKFVANGYGVNRRQVMYNDFVIVGPRGDPAGIAGTKDAAQALARLAAQRAPFVSRGDDSGTHKMELALWRSADVQPAGQWYREAGQGMGRVLLMASELDAYTLCDRGTWLAMHEKLALRVLVQGDQRLYNPYGIIAVNPARHAGLQYTGAMALIDWIISREAQELIRGFRINNEPLFSPLAVRGP